ncbi:MAG TPA: 3-hydroxyacyl-CoA dehydrogenase NAD-binding domain-containing protein [Thermoanaerobaculia bacterium]|nr:3-hydroxyacyl-CoA dehydrogenase NAD-binding domain-containing protein [Thermoanaerobaculia bacterium]
MSSAFRLDTVDGLALVTFDLPGEKVNKFSTPVMEELSSLVDRLSAADGIGALLFRSGKADVFIAGADVREIEDVRSPEEGRTASAVGQRIFDRFARLPFPTVAAIRGACLGGGTELALACDWRVCSDSSKTRIGLPEVNLGILPGWGGTQRLPRVTGLASALDLILTGKPIDGRRAARIGLADAVVPDAIFDAWSESFARGKIGARKPRGRRARLPLAARALEATPVGRALIFRKARAAVLARTRGRYPAPIEALEAVREGFGRKIEAGLAAENARLGRLIGTPVQRRLLRIFFWTEEVKKETGAINPTVAPRPVHRVGILGAGVMGGGIAQLAADRGFPARMKDIAAEPLAHGFRAAADVWREKVDRHRMSPAEFRRKMALLSGGLDYAGFSRAEVTIEAVVEKLEIKQAVLREWEEAVGDEAIFASNTSTLPISRIAAAARQPRRVAGMHFFNPVHRMPLVEVIRGEKSSDETIATIFDLARKMGKTPVVVRDAPGFLVNRILAPYLSEAVRLLEEGCRIEDVDGALTAFGMPVGPLALLDDVGIDVAAKGGQTMAAAFPERLPLSARFEAFTAGGRLGRKTGRGFYRYRGTRREKPDPEAYALVGARPASKPALPPEVIEARLLMPMINEAAFCLEDRIVESAEKLDLAMIFGTGFPPFRGGLLQYADDLGADRIVNRLSDLAERLGPRFSPAALLVQMAAERRTFHPA